MSNVSILMYFPDSAQEVLEDGIAAVAGRAAEGAEQEPEQVEHGKGCTIRRLAGRLPGWPLIFLPAS
jgi:hypothetical protein